METPARRKPGGLERRETVSLTIMLALERDQAERVALIGGLLAKDLGARVVLAHIRADPDLFSSKLERERARHHATERGREVVRRARRALPNGLPADECVELGNPFTRLSELADEVDAALVVVGSRGRGRLMSSLAGSVSQTLAQQSPCPVMIIPRTAPEALHLGGRPGERPAIVVGLEDSTESSGTLAFARQLSDTLGDQLLMVHLNTRAEPPARALGAIAAGEVARLIVVGAQHRQRLRRGRSGSVAGQLARTAPCPVIVVPGAERAVWGVPPISSQRRRA
jgi:nucleotide-binding universal stress UspA family protein